MTLFQWLAGTLMAGLLLLELILQILGRTRRSISSLRGLVWFLALVAILVPSLTNRIANLLSIGRGADVLLYSTAICFLLAFFYLLHAVEQQREQITRLVRRLATERPFHQPMPTDRSAEQIENCSQLNPESEDGETRRNAE